MYGIDSSDNVWFDYDLTGAYTTAMHKLFNPIYEKARTISVYDFKRMLKKDPRVLLEGYFSIKCDFNFPNDVKFPCLPCSYDEDNFLYPLNGSGVFTGLEILNAINAKCVFTFKDIFFTPWGNIKPFGLIKDLHSQRAKHPKGSFENLMCKIIGNGAYGIVSQGINAKMKFDTKSLKTIRMEGSKYSNPILAAWITALVRCVLGEILHNVNFLGGTIISATTDGLITNIENLEIKLLTLDEDKIIFLNLFRGIRSEITDGKNCDALEVKKQGKGMITWSTRGQFSLEAKIAATTGLQRYQISNDAVKVRDELIATWNRDDKTMEYPSKKLRSALDIFKYGGHVTPVYADKVFSLFYDNKRIVIDIDNQGNFLNSLFQLLDTKPHVNAEDAKLFRGISTLTRTTAYNQTEERLTNGAFKNSLDLTIKSWIKALTHNQLNLNFDDFKSVDQIIYFIHEFDPKYIINRQNIYLIKSRRQLIHKTINKSNEGLKFIQHVINKLFILLLRCFFILLIWLIWLIWLM